jgi:hypothetical protein
MPVIHDPVGRRDPAFVSFLGGLDAGYDKLAPEQKLYYLAKFKEHRDRVTPGNPAEAMRAALRQKYGTENYRAKLTPLEKMQLGYAEGTVTKSTTGYRARLADELEGLQKGVGTDTSFSVEQARNRRIAEIEAELSK